MYRLISRSTACFFVPSGGLKKEKKGHQSTLFPPTEKSTNGESTGANLLCVTPLGAYGLVAAKTPRSLSNTRWCTIGGRGGGVFLLSSFHYSLTRRYRESARFGRATFLVPFLKCHRAPVKVKLKVRGLERESFACLHYLHQRTVPFFSGEMTKGSTVSVNQKVHALFITSVR